MRLLALKFALILAFLVGQPVLAAHIVVLGRLLDNRPMMDRWLDGCPAGLVCTDTWWKSIIRVDKTLIGAALSGRIIAGGMQHTWLNDHFKKSVRLFVLESIDDPDQRKSLRADYILKGMAMPEQMFCLAGNPKELGLNP